MKLKKLVIVFISTIVCLTSLLTACSNSPQVTTVTTTPAAITSTAITPDSEKVLNMYVAYGKPELVAAEFEKATGIKVQFLTLSSGEVLTRIQAEKANPQTDVWFGGGSDAFIQAKTEGLISAYLSPNASRVAAGFKDADGYWTGVSLVTIGLVVNEKRLADKKLSLPSAWNELADAAYKGEISASNPNTGGTAYTTVSGILQIMGEEKGWQFLDKMYANVSFLEKSGSGPGTKALQGEFAIGIAPDPHSTKLDNPNAPISVVFPKDGVLAWPSPVAIVTGVKHPNNAKLFIDWCLSVEGQKILMQASPRVPTTDTQAIAGVPNLKELNLVAYDLNKWGAERTRVLAEFNKRYPQYK
jgi:iron(III) transport system substrate-binding protein